MAESKTSKLSKILSRISLGRPRRSNFFLARVLRLFLVVRLSAGEEGIVSICTQQDVNGTRQRAQHLSPRMRYSRYLGSALFEQVRLEQRLAELGDGGYHSAKSYQKSTRRRIFLTRCSRLAALVSMPRLE